LVSMLSGFADSPVLVPNYRKIPKHSICEAIDDCYDGYWWLRRKAISRIRSCWPAIRLVVILP
jgi:acetyl esterase/lipase